MTRLDVCEERNEVPQRHLKWSTIERYERRRYELCRGHRIRRISRGDEGGAGMQKQWNGWEKKELPGRGQHLPWHPWRRWRESGRSQNSPFIIIISPICNIIIHSKHSESSLWESERINAWIRLKLFSLSHSLPERACQEGRVRPNTVYLANGRTSGSHSGGAVSGGHRGVRAASSGSRCLHRVILGEKSEVVNGCRCGDYWPCPFSSLRGRQCRRGRLPPNCLRSESSLWGWKEPCLHLHATLGYLHWSLLALAIVDLNKSRLFAIRTDETHHFGSFFDCVIGHIQKSIDLRRTVTYSNRIEISHLIRTSIYAVRHDKMKPLRTKKKKRNEWKMEREELLFSSKTKKSLS